MTDNRTNPGTSGSPRTDDAAVAFEADVGGTGGDVAFTPAPEKTAAVASDTESAPRTLKDEAGRLAQQAGDRARGLADDGKARATGALDEFSRMMDDAATTVDEKLGEQYGQYARQAAEAISGFSDQLRDKQVDELIDDARGFVRSSPAIAIGTAAALGFVIARLVKAGIDTAADAGERGANGATARDV